MEMGRRVRGFLKFFASPPHIFIGIALMGSYRLQLSKSRFSSLQEWKIVSPDDFFWLVPVLWYLKNQIPFGC